MAAKRLPPFLAGDAAHFWLTKKEVKDADVEQAAQVLERTEASDAWQLTRAQAALAARQGRWEEAVQRITRCRADCPASLEADVNDELATYKEQTVWSRITATTSRTASRRLVASAADGR